MPDSIRFLDEINTNILVGDGAIGTELFARGAELDQGVERLNLTAPDLVRRLHQDYIAAGSRVIETNTFGANRVNLTRYKADDDCREIILSATALARSASFGRAYIAGSIGPVQFKEGEPLNHVLRKEVISEQIDFLLEGGVDLLLFETFISLDELVEAITIARNKCDLPIVAQMAFEKGGVTQHGDTAQKMATQCIKAGANVIGANCGESVSAIKKVIKLISDEEVPFSAYMNAGFADRVENRRMYVATASYLASNALELAENGVRLIGGCCGTNPEVIAEISNTLSGMIRKKRKIKTVSLERQPSATENILPQKNVVVRFLPRLIVEIEPPRNPDLRTIIWNVQQLKDIGVRAVTVADNPLASVRVDSIATAGIIKRETGLEVIPHLTGRDRNRIALQSAIMAAHVMGIGAILCITGDPVRMYNEPNTSGVFDLTSIGLINLVSDFNEGRRAASRNRTDFAIGAALNPNVRNLDSQIDKLIRKIKAGANFILTQPVYEKQRFDMLQQSLEKAGVNIPLYVGLMPLKSLKMAEYLHNEVPGIVVPDRIRMQIGRFPRIEDQRKAGIDLAVELAEELARETHGLYLIPAGDDAGMVAPIVPLMPD